LRARDQRQELGEIAAVDGELRGLVAGDGAACVLCVVSTSGIEAVTSTDSLDVAGAEHHVHARWLAEVSTRTPFTLVVLNPVRLALTV